MIIKYIRADETYDLRHKILRPHRPYEEIVYETDACDDSFHVGAYIKGKLVGIVSFNRDQLEGFDGDHYRLRAMATLPDYRMHGIGRKIVQYGIFRLNDMKIDLVWCKGRENVKGYYENIGFRSHGDVFDYPELGPHVILYKELI
ncbi:GNAT family N-acetyltransferase [Acidaminobacter sp. JC074]|uniref:GNAT family N-acetyltransferase n=1 Tax=Acidaminobacter sp. JC074 TaxID=2530199 RepID=UPI001F10A0BD|nr:GNAT family N-acetyltransferase [Acidaminobacter sp. JC074]MCH4890968.1 GNAT family N-acetyltransferase [Acidaminobacter sp. JC074]